MGPWSHCKPSFVPTLVSANPMVVTYRVDGLSEKAISSTDVD